MLRNRVLSYGLSLVLCGFVGAACATQEVRDGFGEDKPDAGGSGPAINGDKDANSLGEGTGGKTVELEGVTYAPNGKLQLSGVLVYWTRTKPDDIPDGVYCDTCVELPESSSTISAADGSFTLTVPADDDGVYLVVQKGQFRRVRKIKFAEDATKFDKEDTTLPPKTNSDKSDTIPKIAIMYENDTTTYDMIQTALDGLGIEDYEDFDGDTDRVENGDLANFNIMMFPCSPEGSEPKNQAQKDAVRDFVAKGGKIYASDYSHEWADEVFPEYFQSPMEQTSPASAPSGAFDDPGLSGWLTAIGDDPENATFNGVWSMFHGVQSAEVPTPTNDGTVATFDPKVWTHVTEDNETKYGTGEASVSFPYGCGRGIASIFHVHGEDSSNLLLQEKALLYMLLEVSACVKPGGDVH